MSSLDAAKSLIEEKRKVGMKDNDIFLELSKRDDAVGQSIVKASSDIGSRKTGDYLGLNLVPEDVNANNNRDVGKLRSYAESAGAGLANAGFGIMQGVGWAGDRVNEGINNVFGTNLSTKGYEGVTKDMKEMNADVEAGRRGAGREGLDFVKGGTEIAATIPAFLAGGGAGAGARAATMFAGRQAAIGAAVGAAKGAENADERLGNITGNAIGAAVGGVVGEKAISPAIQGLARQLARISANRSGRTATAATEMVDDALAKTEFDIPANQQQAMYDQATKALKSGKEMDAEAMVNQALLEKNGINGTQAQINRDATTWRDEKELAKLNPALMDTHVNNHEQFANLMRGAVDDTGKANGSTRQLMDNALNTLRENDDMAKQGINKLYDDAKALTGADIQLNHQRFADTIADHLTHNIDAAYVPQVQNLIDGIVKQDGTLTIRGAESLKKKLNNLIGSTTDGNQKYALNETKRLLDDEMLQSGDDFMAKAATNPALAGKQAEIEAAMKGFSDAKAAAKQRFQDIENTPILKAALDGQAPDKAFSKYVLNSNVDDLQNAVTQFGKHPNGQQNIADMQGAAIEHFLNSATKSNNGTVSPHALNKAIQDFGEERMNVLFSPEQVKHIKEIKNVSDLLFQQPVGAAVNHSNTASSLQYLMGLTSMLGHVPVIGQGANLIRGAVGIGGDALKRGKATEFMNGSAGFTKGSELGLTEQEKQLIMLARQMSGGAGSPLGAGYGDFEANN